LDGKAAGKITQTEATGYSNATASAFQDIAAHKRRFTFPVVQPTPMPQQPAAVKQLSIDTSLGTSELLEKVQEQLTAVKNVIVGQANAQFVLDLMRPALKLMIDELNTVIVRIDKGEV
jgi:hypothetical protein